MIIIYDNEKIKYLISSLSDVIGSRITFFDSDINIIAEANRSRRRFCQKIFENETELNLCREQYGMANRERKEYEKGHIIPKIFKHTCRWGYTDCFYHIVSDDVFLGIIQYGTMRTCPNMNELEYKSEYTISELNELKLMFDESEFYSVEKSVGIDELVKVLSDYIVKKEYIRVRFDKTIEKAKDYIEAHLGEKLSVNKICNAISVSRSTLYSKFASELKTTVNEYITQRKLLRAKNLLVNTENSIGVICDELGFESSYFSKFFKKETGTSPMEYRKRNVIG